MHGMVFVYGKVVSPQINPCSISVGDLGIVHAHFDTRGICRGCRHYRKAY